MKPVTSKILPVVMTVSFYIIGIRATNIGTAP